MSQSLRFKLQRSSFASFTSSAAQPWNFDVFIVGGGVVGSALALALQSRCGKDLKIGLVEGRTPSSLADSKARPTPDLRVYSLTPASIRLLKEVGAWKNMEDRNQPFDSMQVWDEGGHGHLRFDAAEYGQPFLGSIAENSVIQSALFEQLQASESIRTICPGRIQDITSQGQAGPVMIKMTEGDEGEAQTFSTRLLIGADGGNSYVKRKLGMASLGWGYGQRAVVATVKVGASHTTAWQRYLRSGPLALLPLWNGFSSIVWSTTPSEADRLCQLTPEEFLEKLNEALRQGPEFQRASESTHPFPFSLVEGIGREAVQMSHTLAALADANAGFQIPPQITEVCGPRFGLDLKFEHAKSYVAPRVALVGDAAHTIHPMAGQGLNLGIGDVDAMANVVKFGLQTGQDLGSLNLLQTYERERQPKNLAMMLGLEGLHHLFGSKLSMVSWMRNTGLGGLNLLGMGKEKIAKVAMGFDN